MAGPVAGIDACKQKADFRYIVPAILICVAGTVGLHAFLGIHQLIHDHPELERFVPATLLACILRLPGISPGIEVAIQTPVIALAALLLEAGFTGWSASSLSALVRREKHVSTDFLYMLMMMLTTVPVVALISSVGLSYAEGGALDGIRADHQQNLCCSVAGSLAFIVLLRSFIDYWQHRLVHAVPFLWSFHRVHHSATEMTVLSDYRETRLSIALGRSLSGIAASFFAAGVAAAQHDLAWVIASGTYLLYRPINLLWAAFQHSRCDMTFGWATRYIFVSPAYHRLHHASLPQYRDKNFSADFVVWDWLFGTWVDPASVKNRERIPLGFEGNVYGQGPFLFDYYLRPVVDALRCIFPESIKGILRSGGRISRDTRAEGGPSKAAESNCVPGAGFRHRVWTAATKSRRSGAGHGASGC
jgi:sterol desaturase/sphingolipid hydroxylase (fatty acid hydroxylase superfamily)